MIIIVENCVKIDDGQAIAMPSNKDVKKSEKRRKECSIVEERKKVKARPINSNQHYIHKTGIK